MNTICHTVSRLVLLLIVVLLSSPVRAQHAGHHGEQMSAAGDALLLGAIDFPTSGAPEAHDAFIRGVLALHSFWYPQARDFFQNAREIDPGFAMAYWGEAMSYDHPLWRQLDSTAGRDVLADLDARVAAGEVEWSERERGFVNALRIVYAENAPDDHRLEYAEAMNQLAQRYPDDDEAAVFAALARMTVQGFDFEKAEDVVAVAAPMEALYQRNPRHPGAVHYLIHVYDSPTYAPMGLRPARDYAEIAPASSHAIHMPSHIFRELGMWEEMATSNERAYAASVDWQKRTDRPIAEQDFHAYEWLTDAYLKSGRYADARRLVEEFRALEREAEQRGEPMEQLRLNRLGFELQYRQAAGIAGLPESDVAIDERIDVSAVPAYRIGAIVEAAALSGDEDQYEQAVDRIRYFLSLPAFAELKPEVEASLGALEARRLRVAGGSGRSD